MNFEKYRTSFIAFSVLSIATLVAAISLESVDNQSKAVYLLLALFLVWLLGSLIARRRPTLELLKLSFFVVSTAWLALMAMRLFVGTDPLNAVERLSPTTYMVFLALTILAHLLFSTATGLKVTLAILAGTLVIGLAWLATVVGSVEYVGSLVRLITYEAVLTLNILLLYVLARYKDDYADALLEAERLRSFAYADKLTDLPNRRRLEEDLANHQSLTEHDEHPLSVILFDIDYFKEVNDRYGHKTGDEVLQALGSVVRSLLRAGDVFGRWGGEEFLVIAPETSEEQAVALANRIRTGIARHDFSLDRTLTASFGIASRSEGGSIDDLVHRADELLYRAKEEGRDCICSESVVPASDS